MIKKTGNKESEDIQVSLNKVFMYQQEQDCHTVDIEGMEIHLNHKNMNDLILVLNEYIKALN